MGRSDLSRSVKLIKGSGARRPGSSSPMERASETGHVHVNSAASFSGVGAKRTSIHGYVNDGSTFFVVTADHEKAF